jgi:putative heme-binding domain-containing protein
MSKKTLTWCVALAVGLAAAAPAAALEPWADKGLPHAEGLVLWLDAARQPDAWKAHGRPLLDDGALLDVWYDGSGNGLHIVQRLRDAQPRLVTAGARAAVRFDGKDDHLGLTRLNRTLDAFTVFLVAAPRSNAGGFRALLAAHQLGKNDFTTGFTIDQSGGASDLFEQLNVEGKGFGGARNLLRSPYPFGQFRLLEITCQVGKDGVRLWVDGAPAAKRDREPGTLSLDALAVGARCYSNTPEPPFLSGFLDGDVAEILLYDRALSDAERAKVRGYLKGKHSGLSEALAGADKSRGRPRRTVADPLPVQMLVPAFTVKQLPVDLTNINNLLYRPDGKLVALAYDGNVYLLSDSDGDGLEDRVEIFWEAKGRLRGPIGLALTPPGYRHGQGVFVPSKGKLSLIVDTDGDDRADKEIIVAQGWKEIPQAVDAVGVALDKDGSVYFALGTTNFADAYLVDKQGQSHFDLKSERGTVQKVAPDFSKRETVCTGIRFPVALRFNRRGDLFATDQEGATWLPNGNPFDELLHIQPGRHYGFPPRHPKHLPGVVDEPSVYDYRPQHQSTCGMNFNEPVNGGPVFGPTWWAGDALVCGESRGKIYRTQLAKTAAGYVAQNHLIACLGMLTVDACVSPKGELVVAVHSGPPDWGTGPTGKGKLYKIILSDKEMPQPILAWAAGPREVRIAFDRPLAPARLKELAKGAAIEYGPYVSPGDRFETLRPPYEVVQRQLATPRHDLRVVSVQVTGDRRTLVLTTGPHAGAGPHALTLPGLGRPVKPAAGELPQHPAIDLGYDLCGVMATWRPDDPAAAGWSGWLPHLDLAAARPFTIASAEHDALWQKVRQPGTLSLHTRLDLWHMLRPAVQPGSTLDHTPPPEEVTLTLTASGAIKAKAFAGSSEGSTTKDGRDQLRIKIRPKEGEPLALEVSIPTGREPVLEVAYTTDEDSRPRALPLRRLLLPWAPTRAQPPAELVAERKIPELEGGNWARGRDVFFSEQALCSRCHRVRGQGRDLAPDLSNLVHRDYASVLRDIREPSAALNPDHIGYTVELKDGRVLTGVVRGGAGDTLVVGDSAGKEISVPRDQVAAQTPSPVSVMPQDMDKTLGPERMRDLMTFLLTEPLQPAPLERPGAPPPRSRAEIEAVLKAGSPPTGAKKRLHVVLVAGPKDHGPGEHDYPLWQRRWLNLLSLAENVRVSEAHGWPSAGQWDTADVVVFYSANPAWSADKGEVLDAYLNRGGGLVYLHYAVNGRRAVEALAERIGLASRDSATRFRHGPLELTFTDPKHPIARGFEKVKFVDESYWQLVGDPKRIHVLATAVEEGQPRPLLWTREQGKGRVFVSILGHYTWTFDDPLFRILVLRGLAWTAGEPVERLSGLATVGARVGE